MEKRERIPSSQVFSPEFDNKGTSPSKKTKPKKTKMVKKNKEGEISEENSGWKMTELYY